MATAKRRSFHEMDHDHELLREEIVYASRTELRGPIPEFLAKKRAEQAPGTAAGYEVVLGVFERFCQEHGIATVGQLVEGVAHDFITAERERGMSARTIHDRVRRLKTWTRWMRKRGWTERDRWEDVQTPRASLAEFDLIDPELRRAAFQQFDFRPVPEETVAAVGATLAAELAAGSTVVLVDSGGEQRTRAVCDRLDFVELTTLQDDAA